MPPVFKGHLLTRTGLGILGITIDAELVEGGRGGEGGGSGGKEERRRRREESWSEIKEKRKYIHTLVRRQGLSANFTKIQLKGRDFHQDHHSIIICMYERILS